MTLLKKQEFYHGDTERTENLWSGLGRSIFQRYLLRELGSISIFLRVLCVSVVRQHPRLGHRLGQFPWPYRSSAARW
jgi:hypothetical protein